MLLTRRRMLVGSLASIGVTALPARLLAQTSSDDYASILNSIVGNYASRAGLPQTQTDKINAAVNAAYSASRTAGATSALESMGYVAARQNGIINLGGSVDAVPAIGGLTFSSALPVIGAVATVPADGSVGSNIVPWGPGPQYTYVTEAVIKNGDALPTGWSGRNLGWTDSSYTARNYRLTYTGSLDYLKKIPARARALKAQGKNDIQIALEAPKDTPVVDWAVISSLVMAWDEGAAILGYPQEDRPGGSGLQDNAGTWGGGGFTGGGGGSAGGGGAGTSAIWPTPSDNKTGNKVFVGSGGSFGGAGATGDYSGPTMNAKTASSTTPGTGGGDTGTGSGGGIGDCGSTSGQQCNVNVVGGNVGINNWGSVPAEGDMGSLIDGIHGFGNPFTTSGITLGGSHDTVCPKYTLPYSRVPGARLVDVVIDPCPSLMTMQPIIAPGLTLMYTLTAAGIVWRSN